MVNGSGTGQVRLNWCGPELVVAVIMRGHERCVAF